MPCRCPMRTGIPRLHPRSAPRSPKLAMPWGPNAFPLLGLCEVMQLAGTCRAWHQLIEGHSPASAVRTSLPGCAPIRAHFQSGPLLQVVKQQAQLLARLQGKHGFTPSFQPLHHDRTTCCKAMHSRAGHNVNFRRSSGRLLPAPRNQAVGLC